MFVFPTTFFSSSSSVNPWVNWNGSKDGFFTNIFNAEDIFDIAKFDTNRSIILYGDSNGGQVYAIVATTVGNLITYHIPQPLDSTALHEASVCALDNNRVLICYNTNPGISAVVLSIDSSNNITVNGSAIIDSSSNFATQRVLKLSTDQCILTYVDFNNSAFYGTCITTIGDSIGAPNPIIQIEDYLIDSYNITVLSPTSVFISYTANEDSEGIQGIELTISSNIISKFSSNNLVPTSVHIINLLTCSAIDSNNILVVYEDNDAIQFKAFVTTITDSSGNMIVGPSTTFYFGRGSGSVIGTSNSLCFIDSHTFMIIISTQDPSAAWGIVLSVDNTNITVDNTVELFGADTAEFCAILLDSTRILIGGLITIDDNISVGNQVLSIV